MKTKILKSLSLIVFLFVLNLSIQAQTVAFINNLPCDVVVGFELRDNNTSCNVCDWGSITIPANSTVNYVVNAVCGGSSLDGCFWVISINGSAVPTNHMSYNNCCFIPNVFTGPEPTGCSSSSNYQVINSYPTSWTINP
jgi:hypothetical protein